MPLFYFDIHDGTSIIDPDGTELQDKDEARSRAIQMSGDLLRVYPGPFWNGQEWKIDVSDQNRAVLFTLMFVGFDDLSR
jgi:hypothetical protein